MMASNSRDPLDSLRKFRWLLDPLGIWDDAQQRAREAGNATRADPQLRARAALTRPERPAPYSPRGDLRPATVRRETWDFTFKNLKTGEVVKLRESGKSLHEASVQASHRVRTEIEGLGPEEVSTTWALMDAHQPVTTSLAPAVIGPRERRGAPKEMEFFADSREQLLASANPYRAQMDTAFREAIERVRAGESRP